MAEMQVADDGGGKKGGSGDGRTKKK